MNNYSNKNKYLIRIICTSNNNSDDKYGDGEQGKEEILYYSKFILTSLSSTIRDALGVYSDNNFFILPFPKSSVEFFLNYIDLIMIGSPPKNIESLLSTSTSLTASQSMERDDNRIKIAKICDFLDIDTKIINDLYQNYCQELNAMLFRKLIDEEMIKDELIGIILLAQKENNIPFSTYLRSYNKKYNEMYNSKNGIDWSSLIFLFSNKIDIFNTYVKFLTEYISMYIKHGFQSQATKNIYARYFI